MKKLYTLLFAGAFAFHAAAQDALPKLSPVTKSYLLDLKNNPGKQNLLPGYIYKKRTDGKICVSAIIKIESIAADKVQDQLGKINATVGTKAGAIWTVQVPIENITAFVKSTGISYIQLDEPVIPQLDVARKTTRIDSVHGGYNLPMGYSGKGVLVGIMDFGFDYNHPTVYDTTGTKYRIIKAWEMNGTGTPPAGYSYGHEIADTNLLKAQGTDNAAQTHGANVLSLASGSGYGSPSDGRAYRGGAYESDMILVGVRRDSIGGQWLTGGFSDFIDGVSYMMNYATSVGKPIVVNISWGSHSGPHDGTSLVNQAFDALAGPGKILVMSAGNDGGSTIHLSKTFTSSDTVLNTFLSFSSTPYKRTWVDIWGDTAKKFCVNTTLYTKTGAGNSTGIICTDDATTLDTLISANGLDTCFVQTITSTAEYNMKPRITINIFNKASDSVNVKVSGNNGTINMWDEYYYYGYTYRFNSNFVSMGYPWASEGDQNSTTSDMGAGKKTLLVGSYTTKKTYTDISGLPRSIFASVGNLSSFSSRGPYVDGRIKPDITAPGLLVLSGCNSWDTDYSETGASSSSVVSKFVDPVSSKTYYYSTFSGTSAASPMAAGVIGLLLQIDPTLTPERLQALLANTAIVDGITGAIPAAGNNNWGHGKINAYGAARKLVKELSISSFSGSKKLDCVLFPNPNKGEFTLDFMSNQSDNVSVSVLDISGKILQSQNWKVSGGQNNLSLNLSTFSKGIYFVQVQSNEGSISIKTLIQ